MKIQKKNVKNILPLTPMQEGMLFHYLGQKKKEYLEHLAIYIEGTVEESVFRKSWNIITADHDILRTVFRWKGIKKPVQIVLYKKEPKIEVYSQDETLYWDQSETELKQEIQKRGIELQEEAFYLVLCQYQKKSSIHLVFHHILMDGWSLGLLIKQFLAIYHNLITGKKLEQVRYGNFKDYILAREEMCSPKEEKIYWSKVLKDYHIKKGVRPLLKDEMETASKKIEWELPKNLYKEMEQFCQNHCITMANLFYSAWGLMLQRFNYDTDIVFGTTVSGRNIGIPYIEKTVGLFINTVPLRIKSEPLQTVLEFVQDVQRDCVKRQEFEHTSLNTIGQYAGIRAKELFESIIVIENYPLQMEELMNTKGKSFRIINYLMEEYTNYPLTVIVEANNKYHVKVLYDTNMYEDFTVKSMLESLSELLQDMIHNEEKFVKDLNILSQKAKMRIINEFNDTLTNYPKEENIVSLFRETAKRFANHTAIMYEGKAITYKELDEKSDKLAAKLIQSGLKQEQCIGIMCNRSPEVYVGLLGILKAGGAHVPINPDYPKEQKELILREIKGNILLCNCGYEPDCNIEVIDLNSDISVAEPEKYLRTIIPIQPNNLAYVIYTSGTTGKPKGIMIEHKSVVRLVRNTNFFTIERGDRFLPTSPLEFDVSTFEIWMPILNAVESWLLDKKKLLSVDLLDKFIKKNKITMMWMTTPLFNQIAQVNPLLFQNVRYLIVGGDTLSPYHVAKVRKVCENITLVNGYGPTENTVFSTTFKIEQNYESRIPIGRPIANSTAYVVDIYGHLAPVGAVGELCTGLDGVGRGYLGQEELTREKFVADIVFPNKKMYRSGDLARFLPDGVIDFFGRKDHQVKIRGFRIELTEIECVLNRYDKVKNCVVCAVDENGFDKILVAFVQKKAEVTVEELREYMTKHLAPHCIPSAFIILEELPITVNGKIDRKALNNIYNVQNLELQFSMKNVAETKTEKIVKKIWEKVLNKPIAGIDTNFFELGGTSLHMIQVSSQLEREFHQSVTVVDLFTYTTIRTLSMYLEGKNNQDACESQNDEEKVDYKQENSKDNKEEIAIIGIAGRFPGANTVERFYENICAGRDCISFFSKEELEGEVDSTLLNNNSYVRAKGVVEGAEYFDAELFGYSEREAEIMDPQVRLLHECVFHALENGGYMNEKVQKTGLFIGASPNFEWLMRVRADMDNDVAVWEAANLNLYSLAAPIAYKLNMQGPVVMNSTACSSSLVAVYLACRSLLEGECEMAVAGGVSISLPIKSGYIYQEGMIRSQDGRCRPFREDSDGTVIGDGGGAVLLKPLSKAIKDKDYIYAVIKGGAINNDGSRKAGFTAPSVEGQCQVIRAAFNSAGITGEKVRYIETHGTGTPLGDSIELKALRETYAMVEKSKIALGSIKANIGHLDCAAGIAGLIKIALCLKQGIIPPCVHEGRVNKLLTSPFYLNEKVKKWDARKGVYQAGISGLGIGGTNVHMILEEPPVKVNGQEESDKWNIVPISAMTKESLYEQCIELIKACDNSSLSLKNIASVLQTGRKNYLYRISFSANSKDSLKEQLCKVAENGLIEMKAECAKEKRTVVFLFPGQGSQFFGICKELYQNNKLYRAIFDDCAARLSKDYIDVKGLLLGDENTSVMPEEINQTENAQPCLFVMEYTFAMTLIKLGIQPEIMIGHSLGEYTAAAVSGVISFEECFRLVVMRARLMQKMKAGGMISVATDLDKVQSTLGQQVQYDIAAINTFEQTVISGSDKDMEQAQKLLEEKGIPFVKLHVSHAFHSRMMEPMLNDFRDVLSKVHWNKPTIPYVSNYTGDYIKEEEAICPDYYLNHLRNSVQFARGVEKLRKLEDLLLVEMGANDVLIRLVNHCLGKTVEAVSIVADVGKIADRSFLFTKGLAFLWRKGCKVNWNSLYEGKQITKKPLPGYCFDRKKYWKYGKMIHFNKANYVTKKEQEKPLSLYEPVWIPIKKPEVYKNSETMDKYIVLTEQDTFRQVMEEVGKQSGEVCFGSDFEEINWIENLSAKVKEHIKILLIISEDNSFEKLDNLWENYKKAKMFMTKIIYSLRKLHEHYPWNEVSVLLITSNLEKTKNTEKVNPLLVMVKGIVNVVEHEFQNIHIGCLDIRKPDWEKDLKVVREGFRLFLEDRERYKFQAFRNGQFMVNYYALKEKKVHLIENENLKYHGVYIITGGVGGIGLSIADYLSSQYAATLVLLIHSEFPEREEWGRWLQEHDKKDKISTKIIQILEFERRGSTVWIKRVSLSNPDMLSRIIKEISKAFPKIDGVFHTAGMGDRTLIDSLTEEHIEKIWEPKVTGTICLYQQLMKHTKEKPGFVVLFSSLASIIGGIGQAAYACANAFLDGFVEMAEFYGIPAISINWDTWKETGMAIRAARQLKEIINSNEEDKTILGNHGIGTKEGISILFQQIKEMDYNVGHRTVVVDGKLSSQSKIQSEILSHVGKTVSMEKKTRPALKNEYTKPISEIEVELTSILEEYTGISPVGVNDNFFELGITSLDIIHINDRINKKYANKSSLVKLYTYPTCRKLANYLGGIQEDKVTYREKKLKSSRKRTVDVLNRKRGEN